MVVLNGLVRLVCLQFRFPNPGAILHLVRHRETSDERRSGPSGVMVIEPTENCSLAEFLGELEVAGYEMFDALHEERIDPKDPCGKSVHHMVRFLFARKEFVKISTEFEGARIAIRSELQSICETTMWRVRAFSNPFYQDGEEIAGQRALSINLEVRRPLFCPDGQPVMVWKKNGNGERVGDAPLPLKPSRHLHIDDGAIQLI